MKYKKPKKSEDYREKYEKQPFRAGTIESMK